MHCRCPDCSPDALPTWTPAHRLACEAKLLLRMPLAQRRMELAVPARAQRRQALEAEMKRQWEATRR